jgi:cytidine deaminase
MIAAQIADDLVAAAREAQGRAYAPYSNFPVGAAVRCADGRIFGGANIENASFGATMCAERVALFSAVAGGCGQIQALAIVGPGADPLPPCGLCRQVLVELAPDAVVIMAGENERRVMTVAELLPEAFGASDLGGTCM